jgi:hypothetical protein
MHPLSVENVEGQQSGLAYELAKIYILLVGNSEYIISFFNGNGVPCGKNIKLDLIGGLQGGLSIPFAHCVFNLILSYIHMAGYQ